MAFAGKKVLVTGASSGIGAHVARHLARLGAEVVVAARRVAALEALAAGSDRIRPVAMDVADPEGCRAAVDAAGEMMGGLDAVFNNAGVAGAGRSIELAEEDWARVIDVDLSGVFRVAQASARVMAGDGGGAILNTASILAFGVQPGVAAYAAAKAGVVQLTKALALEWARHGIRVNAIAPGYFPTEMNSEWLESPDGQAMKKAVPMRRFGTLDDLNGPVELLLGPGGAYITGVTLPVDGGHLCRPL